MRYDDGVDHLPNPHPCSNAGEGDFAPACLHLWQESKSELVEEMARALCGHILFWTARGEILVAVNPERQEAHYGFS